MLVSEGLTQVHLQKKPRLHFVESYTLSSFCCLSFCVSLSVCTAFLLHCDTHSLQYVICPFICIQYTALPLLLCCMCVCVESDAQLRWDSALRPVSQYGVVSPPLLAPHWLSAMLSRRGSKVNCSRLTRWSRKAVCVPLSVSAVVYDNRMRRKILSSNRRAEHLTAEERWRPGNNSWQRR